MTSRSRDLAANTVTLKLVLDTNTIRIEAMSASLDLRLLIFSRCG